MGIGAHDAGGMNEAIATPVLQIGAHSANSVECRKVAAHMLIGSVNIRSRRDVDADHIRMGVDQRSRHGQSDPRRRTRHGDPLRKCAKTWDLHDDPIGRQPVDQIAFCFA